jgi:DNA end-binding protein Ku
MRSVKTTRLTFGLLSIDTKVYVATQDHDVHFHQHHADCLGGPQAGAITVPKVCKDCGEVVALGDIVKGITVDDRLVTVDRQELDAFDEEQNPNIEVLEFVHRDDVDSILIEGTYYLDAGKGAEKGYALLRQVLGESDRVGVVRFTMRQKTRMGVLRVYGDVLAIHTLLWHDEVRSTDELLGARKKVDPLPKEIKLMHAVVDSMLGEWQPEQFVDIYTQRLSTFIDAKADGGEFVPVVRKSDKADVADLLAALESTLAAESALDGGVSHV